MQFTAKAVKQGVVLAILLFGAFFAAGWIGAQLAGKHTQIGYPQVKQGQMYKITEPPLPCPDC